MRHLRSTVLLAAMAGTAAVAGARDADACGGCFTGETEMTLVTGHKMALSVSQQQTTLYDQITYSGDPSSFAWILPIKGMATVGLSSDALFENLDELTTVTLESPSVPCPPPPCGGFDDGAGGALGGGPPVTVVAQQTVGPYDTVQLMSSDPNALTDWLTTNGYNIPANIQPIIAAYVSEGFDFLALKLQPGQGVDAMRPVRVTTPGASPVLPLRMVAAGTGMITPITLWIMAEGRYDTMNMPSFQIDPTQLVWDWDTQDSNYTQLKEAGFATTNDTGWLVQAGEPFSPFELQDELDALVQSDPVGSGYADEMGNGAQQAEQADLAALFGTIPPDSLWVTRLTAELSQAALAADLQVGASSDQSTVQRTFFVTAQTGTPPMCPTFPPCVDIGGAGGAGGSGGQGGAPWAYWNASGGSSPGGGGGCAVTDGRDAPLLSGAALLAALAAARRRRRSGRA
jgi:hypothetical protein